MFICFFKVLFEFTVHYRQADANGFMQNWQTYVSGVNECLVRENITISTEWNEEIEQFLALMKLLPAKVGVRSKSPVVPFTKVIDHFIVHSKVNDQK